MVHQEKEAKGGENEENYEPFSSGEEYVLDEDEINASDEESIF